VKSFILYYLILFPLFSNFAQLQMVQQPLKSVMSSLSDAEVEYFLKFIEGNNRFSFNLYKQLTRHSGSFFFSPYSVATGLDIPALGAKGSTLDQFKNILGYSPTLALFTADFNARLANPATIPGGQISVANALWIDKSIPILNAFKQVVFTNFRTHLDVGSDFISNLNATLKRINQWVQQQTRSKINNMLSPLDINSTMRMVLTTAAYINGEWLFPFDKGLTKRLPFKITKRKTVLASMMQTTASYMIATRDDVDVLALPFVYSQGKETEGKMQISMIIFLPKSDRDIAALEKMFTWENWRSWKSELKIQLVKLSLPSFRIDRRLNLVEEISGMGIKEATNSAANFSGITSSKGLFLNQAAHKTSIRLQEEGIDVHRTQRSKPGVGQTAMEGVNPIEISADRPFIFMIWDQTTDAILFMGRLSIP